MAHGNRVTTASVGWDRDPPASRHLVQRFMEKLRLLAFRWLSVLSAMLPVLLPWTFLASALRPATWLNARAAHDTHPGFPNRQSPSAPHPSGAAGCEDRRQPVIVPGATASRVSRAGLIYARRKTISTRAEGKRGHPPKKVLGNGTPYRARPNPGFEAAPLIRFCGKIAKSVEASVGTDASVHQIWDPA